MIMFMKILIISNTKTNSYVHPTQKKSCFSNSEFIFLSCRSLCVGKIMLKQEMLLVGVGGVFVVERWYFLVVLGGRDGNEWLV